MGGGVSSYDFALEAHLLWCACRAAQPELSQTLEMKDQKSLSQRARRSWFGRLATND